MLHHETVSPRALDLLRRLCEFLPLRPFALAGGTSLALRFGHRISVDLDFFSSEAFENDALTADLRSAFEFDHRRSGPTGIAGFIDDVRLDFVRYRYPLIEDVESIDGVRLVSLPDVSAMKLSAITNRGAKKDFFDLHELVRRFGLDVIFGHYRLKYPETDSMMMLRSLAYFEEAELEDAPKSLTGVTWPQVKSDLRSAIREYMPG